jgi:hypothetical protein
MTNKMMEKWTGKKEETNPYRREQHEVRKVRDMYIAELREREKQQELKDYLYANKQIQE